MASLREFVQEIGQKIFSRLDECAVKNNQNFQSWLDDFYPNAVEQIKNLDSGAWRPKTPKRNARKRQSSRKSQVIISEVKSSKRSVDETRDSEVSAGTSHPNPKARKTLKMSKTESSSTQSEQEEDSDKKNMPPPEPTRPKRNLNQSSSKSVRSSKRLAVPKSKLTSSSRKSNSSNRPRESSMHLVLESISTDEGTPQLKANDKSVLRSKRETIVVEKSVVDGVVVPAPGETGATRRTVVIQPVTEVGKSKVEVETPVTASETKSRNGSLRSAKVTNSKENLNSTPLVISDKKVKKKKVIGNVESEKRRTPRLLPLPVEANKINVISNEQPENHTTPRLLPLHDAKRSLHSNFVNCAKTPQSPKQLFSAYTKGDIKEKAMAFERAQLNTPVLHQSGNSPCVTKPRRSSIRKKSQGSSALILAKSARMSTSTRRSSLMRYRLSTVYNNCLKSRLSDKENETLSMPACKESKEEDAQTESAGVEGVQTPEISSPIDDDKKETNTEKMVSNKSPDLQKTSNSKGSASSLFVDSSEESSSGDSASVYHSPEIIKPASVLDSSKVFSSGQMYKRPLPASETKVPNKVSALVSQFDKQYASSSKVQGFTKKKISSSTALTNSGFKQFQKPNHAVASKTSREVIMEMKRAREEEVYRKRQQLLKEKIEESKRKNEEKHQKVKENRLKEQKASETLRRTLEKQEQIQIAAKKTILDKKRSLMEARKNLRLKRELELERRRKEEEEQRLLRQKRLEEQRQQELAELKKQQEKREQEAKIAAAKVKPLSSLNRTYTAEKSPETNGYDITPHRSELPKEELKDANNYDIDDLKSGDETDNESDPKKIIPNWAQGVSLRIAVINQHRNPPNLNKLFPQIETCHLEKIFKIQRSRFQARTSSAVWHEPPIIN